MARALLSSIVTLLLSRTAALTDLSFRRDRSLDQAKYPEGTWAPIPEEGGRIQFVSHTAANLVIVYPLAVDFGSFHLLIDPAIYPGSVPTNGLDWCHSRYNPQTGTLFTSLHAHTDDFIASITQLVVTDASGLIVVNDTVRVDSMAEPEVQVTYATTQNDFQELVVHLHNYGETEHTISGISINSDAVSSIDAIVLVSKEHTVLLFDVSSLLFGETSVWTIVITYDSIRAGFGGRLTKELFPMEDWPKSSQCPFPVEGASTENYEILKSELHVNTHFMSSTCSANVNDVFLSAAQSGGEFYLFPSEYYVLNGAGMIPESSYDGIAAIFVGDEVDSGVEESWKVWSNVLTAQRNTNNKYAVYAGGHSNHLNGIFSGISDIQGMDFYVAGCAPHITLWTSDMPIQGSYEYLFNARENQRPSPTWLYSQGWCADCWSVRNLDPGELVLQLATVVASGAKGMMLFQSDIELRGSESWVAGGFFLSSVEFIADTLRIADPDGASFTTSANLSSDAIVQILASPVNLVAVVINTMASDYNDKTCAVSGRHWVFKENIVGSITIQLPSHLISMAKVSGSAPSKFFMMFEVVNGSLNSNPSGVSLSIDDNFGTWSIDNVKLGTSITVARIFMLSPIV